MRLYRTITGGWAGTQADAGKGFVQVEVPTDKPGLLAFLNQRDALQERDAVDLAKAVSAGAQLIEATNPKPKEPPTLIDVEEFVQAADHAQLAVLAQNVIWRMKELGGLK